MTARQEAPNYDFPVAELQEFFGVKKVGDKELPRVHVAQVKSGLADNPEPVAWETRIDGEKSAVIFGSDREDTGVRVEFIRAGDIFNANIDSVSGFGPHSRNTLSASRRMHDIIHIAKVQGVQEVIFYPDFNRIRVDGDYLGRNGRKIEKVSVDISSGVTYKNIEMILSRSSSQK